MRIQCENCDATYTIDDAQLSDQPIGAQCPYCGHVKLVRRGDDASQAAQPGFGAPASGGVGYDPFAAGPSSGLGGHAPNPYGQGPASGLSQPYGQGPASGLSQPYGQGPASGRSQAYGQGPAQAKPASGLGYSQGPAVGGLSSADLSSADLASSDVGAGLGFSHGGGTGSPFGGGPFGEDLGAPSPAGSPPDFGASGAQEARCQVCGVALADEFDKVIGLCDAHQRDRHSDAGGGQGSGLQGPAGLASGDLGSTSAHWHVRHQGGGVEGPMNLEDLRNRIRSGTISVADEFSPDGMDFGPISRFKDIAYLASLAQNGAAPHTTVPKSRREPIAVGRFLTPLLLVVLLGGAGFLAYQQRATLQSIYDSVAAGTPSSAPTTPNPLKRYLAKWRLRHPDLSGAPSEHLSTARARHLEDTHDGYQAAERAYERALLLDENEPEAIAGYVENLAVWRFESATVDELRVAEAAAHYAKEIAPTSPHPYRALGALALAKGDLNGCRGGADGALQRAATDGRAKLLLAGCFLQGNVQLAIDEAEAAKRLLPELRRADRLLASAYAEAGRFTSALNALDARLTVDPSNSQVHLQYGDIARELGDRALAQRHYKQAVSLPGDKQAAMLAMAELSLEGDDYAQAARLYSDAARERAMHGARAARVYAGWATAELMRKQAGRAAKLADQALSFAHNDAAALLVRGQAALMAGSATTAAAYANRTLSVRSGEPAALVLRARAFAAQRSTDQAVKSLEEAITNDPRDVRLKGILAALYLSVGGSPQAYALMRRAAEVDPLEAHSRGRVGLVGLSPLPVQEALARFRLSAAEERNASVASSAMGMLYYHLGDVPRANSSIARALQLDGANSTALIYSAQLSLDRGDAASAISSARKLLSVERGSALGHLLLARGLSEQKDFEKARREYDSALRSNPGMMAAKVELAGLSMAAGEREAAVQELLSAYRINPYNLRVRQLLREAGI